MKFENLRFTNSKYEDAELTAVCDTTDGERIIGTMGIRTQDGVPYVDVYVWFKNGCTLDNDKLRFKTIEEGMAFFSEYQDRINDPETVKRHIAQEEVKQRITKLHQGLSFDDLKKLEGQVKELLSAVWLLKRL